ncbi:unnamed protein product, partial [Pelagomonas calceolata]
LRRSYDLRPERLVEEELRRADERAHTCPRVEADEELCRVCNRRQHRADRRVLQSTHTGQPRLGRAAAEPREDDVAGLRHDGRRAARQDTGGQRIPQMLGDDLVARELGYRVWYLSYQNGRDALPQRRDAVLGNDPSERAERRRGVERVRHEANFGGFHGAQGQTGHDLGAGRRRDPDRHAVPRPPVDAPRLELAEDPPLARLVQPEFDGALHEVAAAVRREAREQRAGALRRDDAPADRREAHARQRRVALDPRLEHVERQGQRVAHARRQRAGRGAAEHVRLYFTSPRRERDGRAERGAAHRRDVGCYQRGEQASYPCLHRCELWRGSRLSLCLGEVHKTGAQAANARQGLKSSRGRLYSLCSSTRQAISRANDLDCWLPR